MWSPMRNNSCCFRAFRFDFHRIHTWWAFTLAVQDVGPCLFLSILKLAGVTSCTQSTFFIKTLIVPEFTPSLKTSRFQKALKHSNGSQAKRNSKTSKRAVCKFSCGISVAHRSHGFPNQSVNRSGKRPPLTCTPMVAPNSRNASRKRSGWLK